MKKNKTKENLVLLLVIFFVFLTTTNCDAKETSERYFLALKKQSGCYYVDTDNGTSELASLVEVNKYGTIEKNDEKLTLYYLKNTNKNSKQSELYSRKYDLNNIESIPEIYKDFLPSDEQNFNKLGWILNNICDTNDEDSKKALLNAAGIKTDAFKKYSINGTTVEQSEKDLINSIQQAAIYYYTNGNKNNIKQTPNFYVSNNKFNTKINLNEAFTENQPIEKLFKYLITNAENAVKNGYKLSSSIKTLPVNFEKNNANIITKDSNYIIGPYKITTNSNDYNINVNVTDGNNELSDITILKNDQQTELSGRNTTEKVKTIIGEEFYISIPITSSATKIKINVKSSYKAKEISYLAVTENLLEDCNPIIEIKNEEKTNYESDVKEISKPKFDLAIREFVSSINGSELEKSREPIIKQEELKNLAIDKASLNNGTTLAKTQSKEPIEVKTNDRIVIKIRVYNEGQINGKATEITNYLPKELEIVDSDSSEINRKYKWVGDRENEHIVKTDYLSDQEIQAFDKNQTEGKYKIDYKEIEIECRVKGLTQTTDTILKNVVEITKSENESDVKDRDSKEKSITQAQLDDYNPGTSEKGVGYEDDDDFENLIIKGKYFDLALRQFVSQVIDINQKVDEYKREPTVDTTPLLNGQNTAIYKHTKGPVGVKIGDSVIYTIRAYNEGTMDGYADEIVVHLPEELQYANDEFNAEFGWIIDKTDATQRTLKTDILSKENDQDNIIKAFDNEKNEISYKEIKLKCKIKSSTQTMKEITSIAEITKTSNESNLADRDNKSNASIPSDSDLSKYKGNEENKKELSDSSYYYKGQEDDDDFEKVVFEKFDLALRTFATAINNEKITDRIPGVDKSKFETSVDGKTLTTCDYNNKKDTISVCQNDIIQFTIRVYNEGTQDGYVSEITNEIANGLDFLPDDETNKKFKWKMYDSEGNETSDLTNAKSVKTNYWSKESETGQNNIIKAFDKTIMESPNYKEVKIVLKVNNLTKENREIVEKAQISKNTDVNEEDVTDIDSVPNEWNENDDDQDIETLHVKFFDLKLKQNVEQTITIENGIQKESKVNNKNKDNNVAKIAINNNELEDIVIKFKYNITIYNEGEIPGYASEISTYIPDGLKFNQADNINWNDKGSKITTDEIKNKLIQPGESETVQLTLTWINDEENAKTMNVVTEISEYKNDSGTEDINSIPNNKIEGEDDIDNSSVSVSTEKVFEKRIAIIVIFSCIFIGVAIILIKRFVL